MLICICVLYTHTCVCAWKWVRKLTCHLITEISWTDSVADEWLTINRLLFSLNSCLSTSLIKTRRRERKSNQPMKTDFSSSPSALKMRAVQRGSYTPPPEEGAVQQHMSILRAGAVGYGSVVFVNLTLVYSLSIRSSRAEYIAAAD